MPRRACRARSASPSLRAAQTNTTPTTTAGRRRSRARTISAVVPIATSAPAQPEDDRVREVELVAVAADRPLALLVREDREVVGVRRLRPDDLVAQHVAVDLDLVPRHDRPLGVAEQSRMDERKVAEVGEVLHLPRGV